MVIFLGKILCSGNQRTCRQHSHVTATWGIHVARLRTDHDVVGGKCTGPQHSHAAIWGLPVNFFTTGLIGRVSRRRLSLSAKLCHFCAQPGDLVIAALQFVLQHVPLEEGKPGDLALQADNTPIDALGSGDVCSAFAASEGATDGVEGSEPFTQLPGQLSELQGGSGSLPMGSIESDLSSLSGLAAADELELEGVLDVVLGILDDK